MESKTRLETNLANERTFLAYIRTSASILVLAVALLRFFDDRIVLVLGFVTLALGIAIALLGWYRFYQENQRINKAARK